MNDTKQSIGKARKIVGFILLLICAAFVLYFAAVMIYRLSIASAGKHMSAVTRFLAEFGLMCLMSLPAWDVRFGLFTWSSDNVSKVVGYALRCLSIVICALFLALGLAVVIVGATADDAPADYVCVLGLAIDGDQLPQDLVYRLDTAIAYQSDHPDAAFIVTGGNSADPAHTEAAYMARYLADHGFSTATKPLAMERKATNTVENFSYSASFVDKSAPVGVITNNYHLFRATRLAKRQGYTDIVRIPAPSVPLLYLENATWDSICCIFETLRGNMAY
jgi:uncharacterized SAM-binding protein YcdF (DUF218 family)